MPTRSLAVMFTDIKGFTARTSEQTREDLVSLLAEHERLLVPVFRHFKGQIVKTIGDAFLVYFESPTEAVLCGVAVQEVLHMYNSTADTARRLDVRVAINAGDVELIDGDVLGEPVNIAARLEGIAEAGEVYFTEAVYLTMNRREAPSTEVGERTFKGIPHPIRVYKVIRESTPEPIRQIAQRLHAESRSPGGVASKESRPPGGLLPPQPVATGSRGRMLALGAVGLAAVVVGAVVIGIVMRQGAEVAKARELLERGERLNALTVLDARLKEKPADLEAQQLARQATEAHLEVLLKKEDRSEALTWLQAQLESKPYLEALKSRVPPLEAEVVIKEMMYGKTSARQYQLYDKANELIEKYPEDAQVPFTIADLMGHLYIKESLLWMYEEGIKRGHKVEPIVWQACLDGFEDNMPDSEFGRPAHRMAKAHFDAERTEWARKALNEGSVYSMLNALVILDEKQDPAAQDAFARHLRDLAMGEQVEAAVVALLAEANPARGRRATALTEEMTHMSEPELPDAVRATQKEIAARLAARWGAPATANSP